MSSITIRHLNNRFHYKYVNISYIRRIFLLRKNEDRIAQPLNITVEIDISLVAKPANSVASQRRYYMACRTETFGWRTYRRATLKWVLYTVRSQQHFECLQRVRLLGRLVFPLHDAGRADGQARFASSRRLDAVEGDLEDKPGAQGPHGAECLEGVLPDEGVDAPDFLIGEPGGGLRYGDEFASAPHAEGVVAVEPLMASVSRLGIDENRIHRVGIDLPFPPAAPVPACLVGGFHVFQHEPFGSHGATLATPAGQIFPACVGQDLRQMEPVFGAGLPENPLQSGPPPSQGLRSDVLSL